MTKSPILEPELLARVQTFKLKARKVADGVLLGIHHTPHQGRSIEFAEHKEYSPGDDIRRIDWKVFGKSDRLYVKRFEDETNIHALCVIDASASMAYQPRGQRPTKLEHAAVMAAALSWLLLSQSDAAGAAIVKDRLENFLPARAREAHFHEIAARLADLDSNGSTALPSAIAEIAAMLRARHLIIFFSDFFDEPHALLNALKLLQARGHELVLFQVLDPDEINFPFERISIFQDLEGPARLLIDPRALREEYLRHFHAFLKQIKEDCEGRGMDYVLARTDQTPVSILTGWLSARGAAFKRTRTRR